MKNVLNLLEKSTKLRKFANGGLINKIWLLQDGGELARESEEEVLKSVDLDEENLLTTIITTLVLGDEEEKADLVEKLLAADAETDGTIADILRTLLQAGESNELIAQAADELQERVEMAEYGTQDTLVAKHGAKLSYIKLLLGTCPENYKKVYFKAGGKLCFKCILTLLANSNRVLMNK